MQHKNNLFAAIIAVWILTDLTGCATMTPPAPANSNVTWDTRKSQLEQVESWQLNGKIAIITAKDSGTASMDWIQHTNRYTISLYGPLGANSLTLKGGPSQVSVKTSDGKIASAATPEELLAQQWGWNLPLTSLKYWVRGLPVPNIPQQSTFDAAHRLATLSQQGFTINYTGYTTANGMELPQHISITSPTIRSKIVIYKWNIG